MTQLLRAIRCGVSMREKLKEGMFHVPPQSLQELKTLIDEEWALDETLKRTLEFVHVRRQDVFRQRRIWWDRITEELGLDPTIDWQFEPSTQMVRNTPSVSSEVPDGENAGPLKLIQESRRQPPKEPDE